VLFVPLELTTCQWSILALCQGSGWRFLKQSTCQKKLSINRYVDNCFSKTKNGKLDDLLERLNSYHPNIVLIVEENPHYFLSSAFTYDNKFNCIVYKKPGKLPTHWKSEIPTKWKRNCITGALHRAKRISSNFVSN